MNAGVLFSTTSGPKPPSRVWAPCSPAPPPPPTSTAQDVGKAACLHNTACYSMPSMHQVQRACKDAAACTACRAITAGDRLKANALAQLFEGQFRLRNPTNKQFLGVCRLIQRVYCKSCAACRQVDKLWYSTAELSNRHKGIWASQSMLVTLGMFMRQV